VKKFTTTLCDDKQLTRVLNGYKKFIKTQTDETSMKEQVNFVEQTAKKDEEIAGLLMPKTEFDEILDSFNHLYKESDE
jgi:hypothetical protein